MTEKLQQTIKEEIAQLPKEMQEAISSLDWVKTAEDIGNTNKLNEEEIDDFQLETLLVLIGAVDFQFYAVNIENHVGTTKEGAKSIADEAFQKIFTPISNKIEENIKKNMQNKNPNWQQNLDFVLSGGNYSAFIAPTATPDIETPIVPIRPSNTLQNVKDKLLIDQK